MVRVTPVKTGVQAWIPAVAGMTHPFVAVKYAEDFQLCQDETS